jgi:hypothetical protein
MRQEQPKKIGPESTWLQIDTPEAGYAGSVVTLLARISRTPSGRAILERLRASGASVKIERPNPPTDPPNAWTRPLPSDSGHAILIAYDPADWPSPSPVGAPPEDVVLFGRLEDALALATDAQPQSHDNGSTSPAMCAYLRERKGAPYAPAGAAKPHAPAGASK